MLMLPFNILKWKNSFEEKIPNLLLFLGFSEPGYPNNFRCTWSLQTSDSSALIEITIKYLRMEENCKFDKVEFFKGEKYVTFILFLYSISLLICC